MHNMQRVLLWIVILVASLFSVIQFIRLYNPEQRIYFIIGILSCLLIFLINLLRRK